MKHARVLAAALGLLPLGAGAAEPCDLELEGHVTDEVTEDDVPEAHVEVEDLATGARAATATDATGLFHLGGLCPGPHKVVVLADFHERHERRVTLPSEHIDLELHDASEEIVVLSTPHGTASMGSTATVEGAALERTRGLDLAHAVAQVPGVVVARGTADTSKPIVRGQQERRVVTLFDGVRHEGQKWGADHAPELDPFAAGALEVVKGAAGVRYGPDALGGALLVQPRPLRARPGVDGEAHLIGASNGLRGTVALRLDHAPLQAPGFAWRVEGNLAQGSAQRAPDYVIGNTASRVWNAGVRFGLTRGHARLELAWRHHGLEAGVFYGVRFSTPEAFTASLGQDRPTGAEAWRVDPSIDRPSQKVDHDTVTARAILDLPAGELVATYAFQHDKRQETEPARASVTGPQLDFTLRTHTLDLAFTHRHLHLGTAELRGTAGASGLFQENVFAGLPLVPNARLGEVGVFAHERVWTRSVEVELGARYDHRSQTAFLTEQALRRHLARGTLTADACPVAGGVATCDRSFDTGSVSVGLLGRPAGELVDLKLDLSSASRFPDVDELYLNGTAPTLPVYAVGSPDLQTETAWSGALTAALHHPWLELEASGYASYVQRFVVLAPDLAANGGLQLEVLSRGAFPRFSYRAVDAALYGFDGSLTLAPQEPVSLLAQAAVVRGVDTATGQGLPFVPPDRVGATLEGHPPTYGVLTSARIAVSGQYVAQAVGAGSADLAPPPPAYGLLGVSLGLGFPLPRGELELGAEATNLTNARYRDYTSLQRYFADEPGTDVRLRVTVRFDRPAAHTPTGDASHHEAATR